MHRSAQRSSVEIGREPSAPDSIVRPAASDLALCQQIQKYLGKYY